MPSKSSRRRRPTSPPPRSPTRLPLRFRAPPAALNPWSPPTPSSASSRPRPSSRPPGRGSPTTRRCRWRRNPSTLPSWRWRWPGCGCSRTPAASLTSSRAKPRPPYSTTTRCRRRCRKRATTTERSTGCTGRRRSPRSRRSNSARAAQHGHGRQGDGRCSAGRPVGQGRSRRGAGAGRHVRGADDAQAGRRRDGPHRRSVDTCPYRSPQGDADRLGRQADRRGRRGHRRGSREGHLRGRGRRVTTTVDRVSRGSDGPTPTESTSTPSQG